MNTAALRGWPSSIRKGRAGYHPAEFTGEQFEGYFTCDGYQAYHSLPERITVTGCMAHARRRFDEALTVLEKGFHQRAAEGDNRISGNGTDQDAL